MPCGPVFEAQRAIAIAYANCKGASDFLAHDVSVGPALLAERPVENIGQAFRAFAKEIAGFEQEFVFIVRSVLGDWLRVARLRTLPDPLGRDPRIDLEESYASAGLLDLRRAESAARRALDRARELDAPLLEATALNMLAGVLPALLTGAAGGLVAGSLYILSRSLLVPACYYGIRIGLLRGVELGFGEGVGVATVVTVSGIVTGVVAVILAYFVVRRSGFFGALQLRPVVDAAGD